MSGRIEPFLRRVDIAIFPGHLCNGRLFAHQVQVLAERARIHVANLYTHDSVSELAKSALERLPERFVLIANSMGGAVAFEVMRQCPERVEALILIGTTCRPETSAQSSRRANALGLAQDEKWAALTELYAPAFFAPSNRAKNATLDATLRQMILDTGGQGIRHQQHAFATRPDSYPTLASISCPTLVICGREDEITPLELSEELVAGISGSALTVVEKCGHVPMLEHPEVTTQIVQAWLQRVLAVGES
jgi:pimeloyl-ACP methyl ester carboxylesterase